jgi:hypothetical protein
MGKRTGRTFAKWLHRVPENVRHLAEADTLLLMGISQEETDDTKERPKSPRCCTPPAGAAWCARAHETGRILSQNPARTVCSPAWAPRLVVGLGTGLSGFGDTTDLLEEHIHRHVGS